MQVRETCGNGNDAAVGAHVSFLAAPILRRDSACSLGMKKIDRKCRENGLQRAKGRRRRGIGTHDADVRWSSRKGATPTAEANNSKVLPRDGAKG